jgi:HK97 family phage portal protein
MGIATALARRVDRRYQTLSELDALIDQAMSGGMGLSAAGTDVSVQSALSYSTVWACVRAIAETVATLPCILYRRLPNGGKERAVDHRLYDVLHDAPNPEMTSVDYWDTVLVHALTWGNHYSQVVRDSYGAKELWPLEPSRVKPMRNSRGELYYEYRAPGGTAPTYYDFADIFHVHGMSWNGLTGLSVIGYARESIGLGLSLDDFAARYFGNGAQPGGVLEHPGKLSKEAVLRLIADWNEQHQGPANSSKLSVLVEGMKYHQVSIPPEDSQFLQSRQFQAEEIARWFRVPQHKIGLLARSTNNNIEQQAIEFVTDCIRPWLVRVEKSIRRDVMQISDGKRDHFAEFLVDALLRGDSVTRAQALHTMRQDGIINADEWRAIENMNPQPNGDGKVYLVNSTMKPIDQILNPPEPPPPPASAIEPPTLMDEPSPEDTNATQT